MKPKLRTWRIETILNLELSRLEDLVIQEGPKWETSVLNCQDAFNDLQDMKRELHKCGYRNLDK